MTISKESLTLKLTFLFRLLDETGRSFSGGAEKERDLTISRLFSAGMQVLHSTRHDGVVVIDHNRHQLQQLVKLVVAKFNEMNIAIHNSRRSGLPITLTFGTENMIIVEGIDELVESIDSFYQEKQ
jgi:hypothetical protein